jgi:hypothetical protein
MVVFKGFSPNEYFEWEDSHPLCSNALSPSGSVMITITITITALIKVTTMRRDERPREAGWRGRRGGSGVGSIGFGGQQVVAMVLLAAVDEDEGACSGVGVGGAVVGGVVAAAADCGFVGSECSIKVGGD